MKRLRLAYYLTIGLLAAGLLVIGACGSSGGGENPAQTQEFKLDVEELGEKLFQELSYRDQLEELAPAVVYALLGLDRDDVIEMKNYFSSTATAEEIVVLLAKDGEAVERLKRAFELRIEDQKRLYASYAPEEVDYLNGAVLEVKGDYLVFCVAEDPAAAKQLVSEAIAER